MDGMARFYVALVLLATFCASCAHRDEQAYMKDMVVNIATDPPDWNAVHPTDSPLVHCTVKYPYDPLYPKSIAGQMTPAPPSSWLDDPDTRSWYFEQLGSYALRDGQTADAKRDFEKAALYLKRPPRKFVRNTTDTLLMTAQGLYKLGDRETARRLWLMYLERSQAPSFAPMANALRHHAYRNFFALMVADTQDYTQGNPQDIGGHGLQWIYAGAKAGARGDFVRAQADFREATLCGLWDPAYAVFAWGAARFAQGATGDAHDAWLTATTEGDSSPNDPFNNNANAAVVTMLLRLFAS